MLQSQTITLDSGFLFPHTPCPMLFCRFKKYRKKSRHHCSNIERGEAGEGFLLRVARDFWLGLYVRMLTSKCDHMHMVHAHKYAFGISVQLNYRNDLQDGRQFKRNRPLFFRSAVIRWAYTHRSSFCF